MARTTKRIVNGFCSFAATTILLLLNYVCWLLPALLPLCSARLDMLVVSPLLFHSHHTLDKDVARQLAKEHNLHIFVPVREQEDCQEVENAAKAEPYTVECYWRESTKAYWEADNGHIAGFGDFYQELFENEELLAKLRGRRFHVGLAQIHFFSVHAFKLYEMLGIKKTIGISAGSFGTKYLKFIGCLEHAMEQFVPPNGHGKYNTKIGDSHQSAERRQEIVEIYKKLSTEPANVELMEKVGTIFVNSRPELEWNGGKFLEGSNKKLIFIGGFNLAAPKKQQQQQQGQHNGANKPTVLISFGTLIDTPKRLTDAQIGAIRDALGEFPQFHFIWKISENENRLKKHAENVEITHWIDQREKLADPNTVGFISHCGKNSQLEAVVNGVPLICVPFAVDQFYNAETMAQKGAAIGVDKRDRNFSKEKMVKAMEMLLGDMGKSKMKKTKKQQKKLLKQIEKGHRELREKTALLQETLDGSIGEMNAEMLTTMAQIEKEIHHALH